MTPPDTRAEAARAALGGFAPTGADHEVVEVYARIAWGHLAEPGDADAGRLVAALGAARALEAVRDTAPGAGIAGLTETAARQAWARWRPRCDAAAVTRALTVAERCGAVLLTPMSPSWPAQLDDLGPHAPLALWVRGDPHALTRSPPLAVVGARAATAYGEHVAMEMAAGIVARGGAVISGAAYGIDGAAHRAALAAGGTTVAFLAGGVDRAYPSGNARMLEQIASSGAVVSELPPGSAPTKWRFLQRNRLIAAASLATVVVEAGWRSGSLNTAGHAVALGRPLGAVPGPVTSAASAGCHRLLREYDAVAITGPDDAWELAGGLGEPAPISGDPAPARDRPRTGTDTRVVDALSPRSARSTADVARLSGLSLDEAAAVLGLLELEGRAVRDRQGWRRR